MRTVDRADPADPAHPIAAGAPVVPQLEAPRVSGLWLTRRLGVGAHGQVWLASDPHTGDRVAVKLVRDDLGPEQTRQAAERLANEAAVLGRVRHPHVIRLRDTVEDALVLDHLPGGSVADLVAARGPLEPAEVTTVVVPVARALAALHAAGIVHGDVTAANVLLGSDGHPVLADLGAAVEARTGAGSASAVGRSRGRPGPPVLSPVVWGTPGWIDPAAGAARPHPGQDIWGLGALIRFCLTATVVTGPSPEAALAAGRDDGVAGRDDGVGGRTGAGEVGAGEAADGGRRDMLRVATACCGERAARPSAEQVAAMLWRVAAAAPIVMPPSTGPSAPELTRRIRVEAVTDPAAPGRVGGLLGRLNRPKGWRRRAGGGAERGVRARWIWPVAVLTGALAAGGLAAVLIFRAVGSVPERPIAALPHLSPAAATASAAATDRGPVGPGPVDAGPVSAGPVDAGPVDAGPGDLGPVLTRLAVLRAAAISAGSTAALAEVDAPGSAAEAGDRALLQRLAADGRALVGLRFAIGPVTTEPRAAAGGGAGLDVASVTTVVTTSAHTQVDSRTAVVVARVPAGAPQHVRIVLVRSLQGWRVSAVEPVTAPT